MALTHDRNATSRREGRSVVARFLLCTTLLVLIAACSGDDATPLPSPVSTGSVTPAVPTPSAYSPSPRTVVPLPPLPSAEPAADEHSMQGSGSTTVTGDLHVTRNFSTMDPYSYYTGPHGESNLTFLDGSDSLVIGGYLKKGNQRTSSTTALSLAFVVGKRTISFVSGNGSCRIIVTEASAAGAAGSFRCDNAEFKPGATITIAGQFSGSMAG